MTQTELAQKVNHYATGARNAPPSFVSQASTALSLSPAQSERMMIAAAVDNGFDLKLPEGW